MQNHVSASDILFLFQAMEELSGRSPWKNAEQAKSAATTWSEVLGDLDLTQLLVAARLWFNRPTESNFWPNPGNLRNMLPNPGALLPGEARMWTAQVLGQASSQGHTLTSEAEFLKVVDSLATRTDEARRLTLVPPLHVQRACWSAVASMGGHKAWKLAPDNDFTRKEFHRGYSDNLEVHERDQHAGRLIAQSLPSIGELLKNQRRQIGQDALSPQTDDE